MARPPHGAEPNEDTFAHKPILPPFSTFLSDAGRPDIFAQGRPQHIRAEPSISGGAPLNDLLQSSPFKPSDPHQYGPADSFPRRQSIQPDWSFPTTSPLGSHHSVPNPLSQELSIDRAPGRVIVREEVIPGKGLCYIYDDGTIAQKALNGDAVNPKWGTTKAGKPRKRLGQACNTCREKKIKCDPSVPKCAQCQKFGRECKFDTMTRSGTRQTGSLASMSSTSQSTGVGQGQADQDSRRCSTASTELVVLDNPSSRPAPRSLMPLESLLSPESADENSLDDGADTGPPAKKPRVSLSPPAVSEGWPSESVGSESVAGSIMSPSGPPKFTWSVDPYMVDRELTMYYIGKYFNHVDSATTCVLPRRAFMKWVKECNTKSSADRMVLYGILALGTGFAQRAESKHHQEVFVDIANNAMIKSSNVFTLQLVQTKLVLATLSFAQGQYNQAWDHCGSALRIAFSLKFHLEESLTAIEGQGDLVYGLDRPMTIECTRRTFWSAYIMDCFNQCRTASVIPVNRPECHLRLPCSQSAYERGHVPLTPFSLEGLNNYHAPREQPNGVRPSTSNVGVLGYVVTIATIFDEVMTRISKGRVPGSEGDVMPTQAFRQDIMRRLEAWDALIKRNLVQGRDGSEPVNGLRILYHYTAIALHRYVRASEIGKIPISLYLGGAFEQAEQLLVMIQRLSNHDEKEGPLFKFATMSPFGGFAITSALDVVTAAGTMADLMGERSLTMSLVSTAVEALEPLVAFWDSARWQRDMIKKRLGALLAATARASDSNGAFYFAEPIQSPTGLDQDLVYQVPRMRYFEALGWNDKIHQEGDFHRLD